MRYLILFAALVGGCAAQTHPANTPSTLNFPAGKYADFADYMLETDPAIMADAASRNATRDQAHCVAQIVGTKVYGVDYEIFSEAVSGSRQVTKQDEIRMRGREQMALEKPVDLHNATEAAWSKCLS